MFLSNGVAVDASMAIDVMGDSTPLGLGATYYPAGSALELIGKWASYAELYRRQVWVSTVIRKLAFSTARLPFTLSRQIDQGREIVTAHPFAELLARPSERIDAFALWLWTSATYDVFGEAYWYKLRSPSGSIRELHPLHPTNLTIRRNDQGEWEYLYQSSSGRVVPPIPERDVVPFRGYNPENLMRGLSNLEPLRQTLLNEDASRRATASWWTRGARPSVLLQHPKRLSDDALGRLRKQYEDSYGGADNTGSAMVLEEGMTANVIQLSAEEMQYIESRKLNREEVCAAYDVPPPVVHVLDKATFSNITEQMRSMYRDTMAPRLGLFEAAIDHHLRPEFGEADLSASFDLDGVLRGDFEARAAAVAPLVAAGVFKPSEARPLFGLPDAGPVADQLYASSTIVPLGTRPETTPPARPLALASLSARKPNVRALMGALSRKAPSGARDALIAEHRRVMRELFTRQHAATRQHEALSGSEWNDELIGLLAPLTEATAKTAGAQLARQIGGSFAYERTAHYLANNTRMTAESINATTEAAVGAVLRGELLADLDRAAALDHLFGTFLDARADEIATSRVTSIGNFAETESAKQNNGATKTWVVTSGNPRAEHESLDGETVAIDDDFSNGMHFPGDPTAGAEDNANCACTLSFDFDQGATS